MTMGMEPVPTVNTSDCAIPMHSALQFESHFDTHHYTQPPFELSVDPVIASFQSLAGPLDLLGLDVEDTRSLEATIDLSSEDGMSPLLSSGSDTCDDDMPLAFTPVAGDLSTDRILFDWSLQRADISNFSKNPFTASPPRPQQIKKSSATAPRQPRPKQPRPFNKKKVAGKHTLQITSVSSKLALKLLPKVDKPSLGELNGKMPRPVVVNASPRRRRKCDKVSEEEIIAEEEARKVKSVQSARDCRKRKKEYIQGLQLAIKQYDEREAAAQRLIATLSSSIERLRNATAI